GLSDKPDDRLTASPRYDYTLQSRVDDLEALLRHAGVDDGTPVTLAVHDWGGMIGFGWALGHAAQVKRLVVLNTAAFPMPAAKQMPWQIALGRDYFVGEVVIRSFNAFSSGASWLGVERKMPAEVRRAYVAPYDSWKNRISTIRFMQDIPLSPKDKAWPLLEAAGRALPSFADRPARRRPRPPPRPPPLPRPPARPPGARRGGAAPPRPPRPRAARAPAPPGRGAPPQGAGPGGGGGAGHCPPGGDGRGLTAERR